MASVQVTPRSHPFWNISGHIKAQREGGKKKPSSSTFPGLSPLQTLHSFPDSAEFFLTLLERFLPGGLTSPKLLALRASSLGFLLPCQLLWSPYPQLPAPFMNSPMAQVPSCRPLCISLPKENKLPNHLSPRSPVDIASHCFFYRNQPVWFSLAGSKS